MKKYKIPKKNADLRAYAFWKNFKRIFFYVLTVAVMNLAVVSYLDRRVVGLPPIKWWAYLIFEVIVIAGGWIIFNMSLFVTDRYVSGRIGQARTVRSYGRHLTRRAKLDVGAYSYLSVDVVGRTGRKGVKIQLFEDGYDGYYREGATLVKFRGLNYPLCLESEAEGAHICAVCGVRRFDKDGAGEKGLICDICHHSFIDTNEI